MDNEKTEKFYPKYTRTPILCPSCFKKKLMSGEDNEAGCDECGEEFIVLAPLTVKFK